MFRRTQLLLLGVLLALAALVPTQRATAATDRLADLGMARLQNLQIKNENGSRRLRFDAIIVNVGGGPFEFRAQRNSTTSPWSAIQRIYNDAGGFRDVTTPATLVFGGDGHNHWHVKNIESYELVRLDNGVKVGTGAKSGFCFYDNVAYRLTLAYAPQSAVYTTSNTCRGGVSGLSTMMGLSIGWGDKYGANLPDQYIDISRLSAGRYRLRAIADPSNWFQETNENNNLTWVDIQIKGSGSTLKIVGYGPAA